MMWVYHKYINLVRNMDHKNLVITLLASFLALYLGEAESITEPSCMDCLLLGPAGTCLRFNDTSC